MAASAASLLALLFFTTGVHATSMTFAINATGAKELAGGASSADPDGFATGTLTLNDGTGSGSTGFAIIFLSLTNLNLTNLTANHVHTGAANTTGSPLLDFGDPDAYRSGSILSGTVTGLTATNVTSILNNPINFYYNLHNSDYPGGAVRDQLTAVPEPCSLLLIAAGSLGLLAKRRRP